MQWLVVRKRPRPASREKQPTNMEQIPKRMNIFERYLSLWVALCMVAGVTAGKLAPEAVRALQRLELGTGSQINIPIAVLIWLMIYPMMLRIDFGSIVNVGRRPKGLLITVVV